VFALSFMRGVANVFALALAWSGERVYMCGLCMEQW